VLVASIITVRWTLLRYRSDQLLALCWHRFVPMGLGLVMIAGVYRHVVM
jgi:NADH:ubiquinone oxidoreductase subunit H